MAVDLAGKTVGLGDVRILLGTVRQIVGDVAVIVTPAGDVLRIDATQSRLTSDLASIGYGPEAERPTPGDFEGALFFTTDQVFNGRTGRLSIWVT